MTPEEMSQAALQYARELTRTCRHNYRTVDCFACTAETFLKAMREAQAEAYEEAARAECEHCSTNTPRLDAMMPGTEPWYRHEFEVPGDSYKETETCDAPRIRALIDSLVAEEVAP